jgi:hypothetical protein
MRHVGLESTITAFERAKAVHNLDRAVTVVSSSEYIKLNDGTIIAHRFGNCHGLIQALSRHLSETVEEVHS